MWCVRADVQPVLGLEAELARARLRPDALGTSTSVSPTMRPSGWRGLRVTVAETKQCVAPSSSGTSSAGRGAQRLGVAVAPVLVDERALAEVADAGAAAAQEGAEHARLRQPAERRSAA